MSEQFNNGDRVYLDSGEVVIYICRSDDGHIVRPEIEHGDEGESYLGTPMLASRVFSTPPKDRLDAAIAALRNEEAGLRNSLQALRRDISGAEKEKAAQLKEFEKYPNLSRITAFIEGRITHVVRGGEYGRVQIQTFKESFEDKNDYGRVEGLKLVSLLGKPHQGMEWHLNHYKDGSGSYERIVPCESYEEAIAMAQKWLDDKAADWRATGKDYWIEAWVKSAKDLKLTVPDDVAAHCRAKAIAASQERVQKLAGEMEAAQSHLVALQATG